MTTNKKKIFITQTMAACGRALLTERDDIELIEFPNLISAPDFEALLRQHAPVHGVALGATRFGETELEAARDMKVVTRIGVGFDAVDVPALSRRKVPLDGGRNRQFAVGGGTGLVHDADACQARQRIACAGQGWPMEHAARQVAL